MTKRVADAIVERLRVHGTPRVFTVAGESYLDVLDSLYESREAVSVVTCRHEAAAANMAEATGKLSGRPGVALVTRGPGLAHASIGVHTAQQDATPMILFVGEIAREDRGRRAFQEVDLKQTFADLAKAVLQIDCANRAGEVVDRAFQLAVSGRPGPIVVGLPEDVLGETYDSVDPPVAAAAWVTVAAAVVDRIQARLEASRRPLLWLGGGGWSSAAVVAVQRVAEHWDMPVVTGFRRKDLFANAHACYAGELGFGTPPALVGRLREADLLLVLGAPLSDIETGGYRWLDRTTSGARLIHVHADADGLSALFPAEIAVVGDPGSLAIALAQKCGTGVRTVPWSSWTRAARADQAAFMEPVAVSGTVNLSVVFRELRAQLPASAVVTNGAGNYAAWLHRFYSHDAFPTQIAPGSGAMGYAVPAAIAAKLALPQSEVICVAGDGCFLMSSQELATAAALGLKIIFLVVNNGSYGTIRMHQEARFPGRTIATELVNPDFVALARAFGLVAMRVESTAAFGAALASARGCAGPALIELCTAIDDISPGRRLRAPAT
ncbi:MAG: thiamine pyrophosphate-binding protein [Steroidobacteraceae bacterium]